ncbi:alpha/beta hydrolase family protein [Flagellimonas algicola]|uniref:Xylan esterase n=1 Tax=Flagellimonas algicola TaxID=2583815 RepID=A0ABY2WGM7_9FLAO|nr:acetylxylan esterase [Allomuricauda algicola]TMU50708.1 xylan esterase [Allomuricauda algicola]
MKHHIKFCALCLFILSPIQAQEEDIGFFDYWASYSDLENSLYKHFSNLAYSKLEERKRAIGNLKTQEDWLKRQALAKKQLMEIVGPFPDKSPLNAKITGVLKKDGYRIEKIIYESMPDYYVTGALYLPDDAKDNTPAIFYACGHSLEGFRAPMYQHIIINLVKKGFIVFTIDPMGQGERYNYWNHHTGQFKFKIPDHEHSYAGAQCLISGYSTGNYFIWDVLRGIDYMLTRKEVDGSRLGMTGRSGGGNLTAYLGALDDRILATAPECYITSYEFLYRSIGPQCAEQNLYQLVDKGLDHADFIEIRAPKPTMVIATTRDFFSIQGTRETFDEAQKMYTTLNAANNLTLVEDDDRHTSTKKNREAMYAFFQKELNNPGSREDLEVGIPSVEELKVSKTGQLISSNYGRTIFDLNRDKVEEQNSRLQKFRRERKNHISESIANAKALSGFIKPRDYEEAIFSGRHVTSERILEKYLITGSGDYKVPAILLKPKNHAKDEIIVYFDTKGMEHAIDQDTLVPAILQDGYSILLADLPGMGILGPGYLKGDSYIGETSYNQWFGAMLVGKSFVGLRAEDMLRLVHFAKNHVQGTPKVSAIAVGPIGAELLHAAAFDKTLGRVGLVSPFLSYYDIATTQSYDPSLISFTVPGALKAYDLPDLMASIYPRNIKIVNPISADGNLKTVYNIESFLESASGVHKPVKNSLGPNSNIQISIDHQPKDGIIKWLGTQD